MRKLVRLGQAIPETQDFAAGTNGSSPDHITAEIQQRGVRAGAKPRLRRSHREHDTHPQLAAMNGQADLDHLHHETQSTTVGISLAERKGYLVLGVLADTFSDVQDARKAIGNRVNNKKVPIDPTILLPQLDAFMAVEKAIGQKLDKHYVSVVPEEIRQWQLEQKGIGEHLLARLLGHLGHPCIAFPHHWETDKNGKRSEDPVADPPYVRSVGELWQYAGHGEQLRRRKGMSADDVTDMGNPKVKMCLHLISESSIKERGRDKTAWESTTLTKPKIVTTPGSSRSTGAPKPKRATTGDTPGGGIHATDETQWVGDPPSWPYRAVYEARRRVTLERVHADSCIPCGRVGHPAEPGTPWKDGHKHADALRIVGKEILRDLYVVAHENLR